MKPKIRDSLYLLRSLSILVEANSYPMFFPPAVCVARINIFKHFKNFLYVEGRTRNAM